MDNPETLATMGTQVILRGQTKQKNHRKINRRANVSHLSMCGLLGQLRQEDGKIYLETIYLAIFCGSLEIGHEYHYIVSCSGLKEEENNITNTQSTYNPNTSNNGQSRDTGNNEYTRHIARTNKQKKTQNNKQTSERIPP
jgi:hypothetical protein